MATKMKAGVTKAEAVKQYTPAERRFLEGAILAEGCEMVTRATYETAEKFAADARSIESIGYRAEKLLTLIEERTSQLAQLSVNSLAAGRVLHVFERVNAQVADVTSRDYWLLALTRLEELLEYERDYALRQSTHQSTNPVSNAIENWKNDAKRGLVTSGSFNRGSLVEAVRIARKLAQTDEALIADERSRGGAI